MIGKAIFARLTCSSGVYTCVGVRIYPATAPADATYPLIVYQQISGQAVRILHGPAPGFDTSQQLDIYATTQAQAEQIAAACRASLDACYNQIWGGVTIRASRLDSQIDEQFERLPGMFRIIQQYTISI